MDENRLLIGGGSESDRRSIPLSTKKGEFIPNEKRLEKNPSQLKASEQIHKKSYSSIRLRSLTSTYNCVGMVFASRRVWVDTGVISQILKDDEYKRISADEVQVGDIVLYRNWDPTVYSHIGIVIEREKPGSASIEDMIVLSKWGQDGEYLHRLNDVSPMLGQAVEFWSEKKSF